MNIQISKMDQNFYKIIRLDVSTFIKLCARKYDKKGKLLDIAPQVHEGAMPYFKKSTVYTLDIDPSTNPNYCLDICKNNQNSIADSTFDFIVCTEVLEHVIDPFAAIKELYRILKPQGYLFLTTPFNFRIHGPLPDCWRFTEHGLRVLLNKFTIISLSSEDTKNRALMPIHYRVIARKM